jgi:uncharacterized protein YodC (DUF2158 family)
MLIGVSKKKRFAGSDRCSRWFEGRSSVQGNYREEQGLLPLSADRSWRLDLNLRAGPTGSCNSVAIFFALKKDGLPAPVIQFGFSPYTSNSPETLVEPKLPPVLFPRVPT